MAQPTTTLSERFVIRRERPDQPPVLASLEDAVRDDGVRLALLETGAAQAPAVGLYQRCGYLRRAAFGGYPDNGLSLFFEKRLRP